MIKTNIEVADHAFNPWKEKNGTRVLTSPANWKLPLKWNREAEREGVRKRVFCASLADVFEDWKGPILNHKGGVLLRSTDGYVIGDMEDDPAKRVTLNDTRRDLFALIDTTPHLDWLLLTKRPENVRHMMPFRAEPADPPYTGQSIGTMMAQSMLHRPNVWLGTSIATQADADKNIPELLKCRDLSPVLFVSAEPLLGPVDIIRPMPSEDRVAIDRGHPAELNWLIIAGESSQNVDDFVAALREEDYDLEIDVQPQYVEFDAILPATPTVAGRVVQISKGTSGG